MRSVSRRMWISWLLGVCRPSPSQPSENSPHVSNQHAHPVLLTLRAATFVVHTHTQIRDAYLVALRGLLLTTGDKLTPATVTAVSRPLCWCCACSHT